MLASASAPSSSALPSGGSGLPPLAVGTLVRLSVASPALRGRVETVLPSSGAAAAQLAASGRVLVSGGRDHAGVAVRREALTPVVAASLTVDFSFMDKPGRYGICDLVLHPSCPLGRLDECSIFTAEVQAALGGRRMVPTRLTHDYVAFILRGSCSVHCIHFLKLHAVGHHLIV